MIFEALHDILSENSGVNGLVGENVFHAMVPLGKAPPAITFQLSGQNRQYRYCYAGNVVGSRFIVNCYAKDTLTASQIADAVRHALNDFSGTVAETRISRTMLETGFFIEYPEPGLKCFSQDWVIWHTE